MTWLSLTRSRWNLIIIIIILVFCPVCLCRETSSRPRLTLLLFVRVHFRCSKNKRNSCFVDDGIGLELVKKRVSLGMKKTAHLHRNASTASTKGTPFFTTEFEPLARGTLYLTDTRTSGGGPFRRSSVAGHCTANTCRVLEPARKIKTAKGIRGGDSRE